MSKREIIVTELGEMRDMIACLAIYNGAATPTTSKLVSNFDESLEVR